MLCACFDDKREEDEDEEEHEQMIVGVETAAILSWELENVGNWKCLVMGEIVDIKVGPGLEDDFGP